ncbi:MAG: ribosome silencing factor [Caldicoprobacterales bacterium]|nr:ribosome silencing factor [Clostridiales bacterium]
MLEKSKKTALKIAQILEDRKAIDVVVLDIHSLTIIADYFVIASGGSETQVRALYEEVEEKMRLEGIEPVHKDGHGGNRWIALDYGDVIVHIFHQDDRSFYNLERLWADGIPLSVDNT